MEREREGKKNLDALRKAGVDSKMRETETRSVSQSVSQAVVVVVCEHLPPSASSPAASLNPPNSCAPQNRPHNRGQPGRPLWEAEGGGPDPGGEQPVHCQHAAR